MTEDPSDEVRGPGLLIARHYASETEAYRDLWAPVLVRLARWLTDEIPLRDARRILDLGRGVGALLPHLRDASPEAMVVGLDRTQTMVALTLAPSPCSSETRFSFRSAIARSTRR